MIRIEWLSPTTGERRSLTMTQEQAAEWWAAACYLAQCSARITEVKE